MKNWLLTSSLLFTGLVNAAGSVDFLEVDNDVVLFTTTEAKTGTRPACMSMDNDALWSVSLTSESGRAMYSLILTAMAKGESVGLAIESAGDCANADGIERASKVSLTSASSGVSSSSAKSVGVYKGDGVTRLGTLLHMQSPSTWYYANAELSPVPLTVINANNANTTVRFTGEDCTGTAFLYSNQQYLYFYEQLGGQILLTESSSQNLLRTSEMNANGQCIKRNSVTVDGYELIPGDHPTCGPKRCMLKEE